MPYLAAAGRRLDYRWIEPQADDRPALVFLHEGLGSVELWKDFPDEVAAATRCGVLVYSRFGYGRSDPLDGPRGTDYLHREAREALPDVLAACAISDPVLIGHSDGASIALIHAATANRPVRGLVLEAPHVFVEDVTIAGIEEAGQAWRETDLGHRLARYHADPRGAFQGWYDTWLNPDFRAWNIEAVLPAVTCPILLIQGEDDEYATLAQLDAIERQSGGRVERLDLPACGHSPHRERPRETLDAIVRFVGTL